MPCTAHISLALRSVSRWALLPFTLASAAALLLLLRLLALALRKRTPQALTQAPDDLDDDDTLDDPPDYQPADDYDNDFWLEYLNASEPHRNCVHHLTRCYHLDPAKHSH
jgi:hypothetical protein